MKFIGKGRQFGIFLPPLEDNSYFGIPIYKDGPAKTGATGPVPPGLFM